MQPVRLLPVLLLAGCQLFELAALKVSHPPLDGELQVDGLDGPLRIVRDELAIPHVRAGSEHDAWFGLGFVHGQDRFFQADLLRHLAWGEMSLWLGEDAVELDVFQRALDLRRLGAERVAAASPEARAMLEAYAEGMNAGVASLARPPIEHRLLGLEVEPWDAVDCYAVLFLQSWNLSENPTLELLAWMMRGQADGAMLDDLLAFDARVEPVDAFWEDLRHVRAGAFTPAFQAFSDTFGGRPDAAEASNNWVVGGARTESGLPILANDPHLGQAVPSLWYMADVQGGDVHVAGATLPGVPGVPIGHNETVAWGLTNVMADVVDVAVLRREGTDGYVLAGASRTLERATVTLAVRDETVEREVVRTELGPVISELDADHLLALQWHALFVEDRLPELLRGLALAETVDDVLALRTVPAIVAQNLVVADTQGAWAWQSVGTVPVRPGHTGRVPYPASEPGFGWQGWYLALAGEREPARGYTLTANTHPPVDHAADGTPVDSTRVSSAWIPDTRFRRIEERLEVETRATPASMSALQRDLLDTFARDAVPGLLRGTSARGPGAACRALLADWDFRWSADSAGAAVWAVTQRHLIREALRDDLTPQAIGWLLASTSSSRNPLFGHLDRFMGSPAVTMDRALGAACVELVDTLGEDATRWTWGALHPLALKHPFAGGQDLLAGWNLPVVPFGGSGTTVAAAGFAYDEGVTPVTGMASLRLVVPLDDVGAATLVHPGGPSGHPGHPDRATAYEDFVAGRTQPLHFRDADVEAAARDELTLTP